MSIRVTHDIHDLSDDLAGLPVKLGRALPPVVKRNAHEGNRTARKFARTKAGPHGKNYYKRLTVEMTGPYSAEYGPEGDPKTEFVGAGWRHGVNLDLPNSADLIGPKLASDVGDVLDRLFW